MFKKIFIIIIIAVIILGLGVLGWDILKESKKTEKPPETPKVINSFEECVAAGYPVLESYPRQCKTPDEKTFTEDIGNVIEKMDLIRVSTPQPNETVKSPLEIKGEARGSWFFEAQFPIKIQDENGKELESGIARAQGGWMTTDFVPFEVKLEFQQPTTKKGKLILEKDNPSDLPQNADELHFPVNFQESENTATPETMTVKAFFNNGKLDPEFSCNKVFPVEREIPKIQAVGRATLEELLKGPADAEKNNGYFTSINPGVKIQSLTIENGIAKVDFDEQLEFQVGGSCKVAAIRAQITETLKQFPTVNSVVISINGRTEDILQP